MQTEISIIDLFIDASFLVQLIMALLVFMSILSWAIIFNRNKIIKTAKTNQTSFEQLFWSGVDLNELFQKIQPKNKIIQGSENIFYSGFKEFIRLHKNNNGDPSSLMDGAHRSMRIAISKDMDELEDQLSTLATIGSISPYIGLFGTVWGIMNAFIAIGSAEQATLNMVAPSIAEALIATAMGLFAAIPATMSYNKFITAIVRLENSYVSFMEEFSNILHRQAYSSK